MVYPDTTEMLHEVVKEWTSPPPPKGKKIEIVLMWGDLAKAYKVMIIKNTTWYRPGIWLSEEIVSKICELPDWTVTLEADDLWKNVLSFIGGKLPGLSMPA